MTATTAPHASEEASCPKCGGRMWDNRATKKNPKAPDFKCRDRTCDGVIWPPKEGQGAPRAAAPAPVPPVPAVTPGRNGYDAQGRDFLNRGAVDQMDADVARYNVALAQAHAIVSDFFDGHKVAWTAADVLSCAATLFIQRSRRAVA